MCARVRVWPSLEQWGWSRGKAAHHQDERHRLVQEAPAAAAGGRAGLEAVCSHTRAHTRLCMKTTDASERKHVSPAEHSARTGLAPTWRRGDAVLWNLWVRWGQDAGTHAHAHTHRQRQRVPDLPWSLWDLPEQPGKPGLGAHHTCLKQPRALLDVRSLPGTLLEGSTRSGRTVSYWEWRRTEGA